MPELYFDDVQTGEDLPSVIKGPMSSAHIMRWSSAIELWHRIHFDQEFARSHDGLPDLLINGSWKQHVLIQLLTDWAGRTGWLWKIQFQYRGMNARGETLTAWGRVAEKADHGRLGVVEVEIGLRNERGQEGTPGRASVVLPKRGMPAIPYPFDPAALGIA